MRILILSHGHPAFSIGGAEVASHNLFRALGQQEGVAAFYLARAPGHARPGESPLMSLRQGPHEAFLHAESWDPFWLSNSGIEDLEFGFADYISHIRPDVVHFHHVIGLGLEAIVQVRRLLPRAAIVVTFHEYLPICLNHGQMVKTSRNALCRGASPAECAACFPQHSPARIFQRETFIKSHLALADAFVSPSQFLIERYVAWGLDRALFRKIENGLAPQDCAPARPLSVGGRRSRFGFFGQLSEFKGLLVLLEAVASMSGTAWGNASLCIFGGNLERQPEAFRHRFDELMRRAGRRVRSYGSYRSDELPRLMEQVDWIVMPSIWWENSPVVIQEAFLHGRPPIVADIGGMAEKVQHNVNGLQFRAGSPEDLADRLTQAILEDGLWEKLRAGAPKPPGLQEFATDHLDLYRSLLSVRGFSAAKRPPRKLPRISSRAA